MELYTTPQVANLLGIPSGTLRSWLSRYPGLFQVGVHLVIEESGRKLWTSEGVKLLKNKTESATQPVAESVASQDSFVDIVLEPALEEVSSKLLQRFWQLLPQRVLEKLQRQMQQPTEADKQMILNSLQQSEYLLSGAYESTTED